MSAIVSVAAVVVDCRRSAPLAAFYQAAFGGEIFRTDEDSAWLRTGGLTVIFRGFTHQTPYLHPPVTASVRFGVSAVMNHLVWE
jgi:hypothetical protein